MLKLAARWWLAARGALAKDGRATPRSAGSSRRPRTRRCGSAVLAAVTLSLPLSSGCTSCSIANDKSPYFGTTERKGKDLHTFYVNNGGEPGN